jgi:hypothetical protein
MPMAANFLQHIVSKAAAGIPIRNYLVANVAQA